MTPETTNQITRLEAFFYGGLAVTILLGLWMAIVADVEVFQTYITTEDGVLESFTSFMLFVTFALCVTRMVKLRASRSGWFLATTGLIAFLMFFGAGEEISWGQRVFGWETGETFQQMNRQGETNLHNLEINGVNINKVIFGQGLTLFLILYYLVLPQLYMRKPRFAAFFDRLYVPVPKVHHGLTTLAAGLIITSVASSKRGELNEVWLGCMFFMTVYRPQNCLKIYKP
ncbi:hypothetical protein [Nereida sp. MMG025]|uniref:hypothetical protein n=1 Tax=Nereida sp. MMG025 TaxID=2909981 RepID=UPI001F406566|nr:hypothetical protein [Nereida sp. MMG025]MCF6445551.1 hypothetical protein [Nereida sp. MMG025]